MRYHHHFRVVQVTHWQSAGISKIADPPRVGGQFKRLLMVMMALRCNICRRHLVRTACALRMCGLLFGTSSAPLRHLFNTTPSAPPRHLFGTSSTPPLRHLFGTSSAPPFCRVSNQGLGAESTLFKAEKFAPAAHFYVTPLGSTSFYTGQI